MFLIQIIQVIISIILVGLVLIQGKGTGLSSAISGSIAFYGSRRGIEKVILFLTIFIGLGLVVNSFLLIFLS